MERTEGAAANTLRLSGRTSFVYEVLSVAGGRQSRHRFNESTGEIEVVFYKFGIVGISNSYPWANNGGNVLEDTGNAIEVGNHSVDPLARVFYSVESAVFNRVKAARVLAVELEMYTLIEELAEVVGGAPIVS